MEALQADCGSPGFLAPCTIVIFGASGDLTSRKLIPALYKMFRDGYLPKPVTIIGCARTDFTREGFIEHLSSSCCLDDTFSLESWRLFSNLLFYHSLDYVNDNSYRLLAEVIASTDREHGTGGNIVFDLAVPPTLYAPIAARLGAAGLARPKQKDSWVRLIVEKPFGRNLETALELERLLHVHFAEEQIFRIDHYLAKETVQNILSFRFANQIFEPLWNRRHVEWVGILSCESLGVETRAGYYDNSGVLRDMFQNHMMQLLSLVAMEPPSSFEADAIRDEKVKIFKSIPPMGDKEENIILGQYQAGELGSQQMKGYLEEKGVRMGSKTPTFALLKVGIDNWRWQGVPFYLVSGKRMRRKETRIVIQFKEAPLLMFSELAGEHVSGNRLILSIYPEESISLSFQTKIPGPRICLQTMNLDYKYTDGNKGGGLSAYEKVLLDCILGDHMLFWRQDGVASTWEFFTPILEDCEGEKCMVQTLHPYPSGSWGPKAAEDIVKEIVR